MSRMHSSSKGASGSKKPFKKTTPTWIRYKPKEVEMLIAKMAKDGKTTSVIGQTMRDTYGIPDIKTVTGKRITAILKEKKMLTDVPEDLRALIRRASLIRKHLGENKLDNTASRGLHLCESKIKRLVKYYKTSGRMTVDWKYDPNKSSTYLE